MGENKVETRNPKTKIQTKTEGEKRKIRKGKSLSDFGFSVFGFYLDFGFRVLDFPRTLSPTRLVTLSPNSFTLRRLGDRLRQCLRLFRSRRAGEFAGDVGAELGDLIALLRAGLGDRGAQARILLSCGQLGDDFLAGLV